MILNKNKFFQLFLSFLLILVIICLEGFLTIKSMKDQTPFCIENHTKSEQAYIIFEASSVQYLDNPFNRHDQMNEAFLVKLQSKLQQCIRLFFYLFTLFFLLRSISKKIWRIYQNRMQYFIVDLDIYLLSSRAHPPTY
jgi:hypothetical protein